MTVAPVVSLQKSGLLCYVLMKPGVSCLDLGDNTGAWPQRHKLKSRVCSHMHTHLPWHRPWAGSVWLGCSVWPLCRQSREHSPEPNSDTLHLSVGDKENQRLWVTHAHMQLHTHTHPEQSRGKKILQNYFFLLKTELMKTVIYGWCDDCWQNVPSVSHFGPKLLPHGIT